MLLADLGSGARFFGPWDLRSLKLHFSLRTPRFSCQAAPTHLPYTPDALKPLSTAAENRSKQNMTNIPKEKIENLKSKVKGQIVLPSDPSYNEVREIWNAMIERRPALIVRCAEADDVPHAISFARENGLEISIRGGGHNIAGNALCNNGVMIDFSTMRNVRVDAEKKRAYVEPGATLADFDEVAQSHGLATPVGINSTTGIGGLTLGGGFGWLTRKYGMTIDNLISVDVVTADGKKIRASENENGDLFWAIRGGGGNFAAVTQFEFKLHEVGPEILAGLIVFPFDQAKQVLTQYRQFVESTPEELNVWAILRKAPPLPFLPEKVHGKEVVVLVTFYLGNAAQGRKLIEPLLRFGDLHGEHIGFQPYAQWQKAFDPLLTPGARNYWKSHNFTELRDGALDSIIEFAGKLPSPQCEIFIGLVSGAANRVPADAMAYRHRDANFVLNVHGRWNERADDARCIAWARAFFHAAAPFASAGAYVNFMTEEESDRVAAAYGANYDRLAQIKKQYDPDNLFHLNQNIKPSP
jgi:FAD/FMN-containing dehydrogenase